jgi:E3 ubiquitin-protein ligase CHFR
MEQPREGEQQPQQQPWGRLLRLGAEEDEPHVLLWKREWTIGRRRGAGVGERGTGPGTKEVGRD